MLISILFISLSSCNYFDSGVSIDDPKSWDKLFYEEVPSEVNIIHSYLWKSSHFTYEIVTYFEIEASKEFIDGYIIKKFDLRELGPSENTKVTFFDNDMRPEWFVPKSIDNYVIWEAEKFEFKLLMDKGSKQFFFYMYQF